MIPKEILERYVDLKFFVEGSEAMYREFLKKTDYIGIKLAEALFLGESLDEDYTEVLAAKKYAREQIRQLTNI